MNVKLSVFRLGFIIFGILFPIQSLTTRLNSQRLPVTDVTNTGNGKRGTGNGERGTGNGERESGNECTAVTRLRSRNGGRHDVFKH